MSPRRMPTGARRLAQFALAIAIGVASLHTQAGAAALTAEGDLQASFINGMFLLPELKSAKDYYLIVIQPTGEGQKPVKLKLPAGSTGLRVSEKVMQALPAGTWTWTYKVGSDEPAALGLITQPEVKLLANQVPRSGQVVVRWNAVPAATQYAITGKVVRSDLPVPEAKLDVSCSAKTCLSDGLDGGVPQLGIDAAPGSDITWRVSALDKDDVVLARSAEAHITVEQTAIQNAKARGLSIQQSDTLSKPTATDPALLSYTSSNKGSAPRTSAYQAQFALIYNGPEASNGFYPRVTLEAHLTSNGADKANDALSFRFGGYKMIWRKPGEAQGTQWVSNLKYETERKTGTKKGLVEFAFTPIYGPFGMYYGPSAFGVMPTFSFGSEVGKTFDVGSSEEKKDTLVRLRATARFDARLTDLAGFLGFRSVSAYLQATQWYLPKEDGERSFQFGSTGLSFGLTDFMSFDLAYSAGRKAPLFTFERAGTVGIGVKF